MNYLSSMKKLQAFDEKRKEIYHRQHLSQSLAGGIDKLANVCESGNIYQIPKTTEYLLYPTYGEESLSEYVERCATELEMDVSNELRTQTTVYESRVAKIREDAKLEIEKNTKKPLAEDPNKIMALLFSSCAALVLLVIFPMMIKPMLGDAIDSSLPGIFTLLGLACAAIPLYILRPVKEDKQKLESLDAELKNVTKNYVRSVSPIFQNALTKMNAKYETELSALTDEIKAEVGDHVLALYEEIPFGQRQYFLKLGITATCEEDLNAIALECFKADKADQQIALQQHLQTQAQNEMKKNLDEFKKTARQMQDEANANAARIAEQNKQFAEQNERHLKNQSKAIDELKKRNKIASDIEYQIRRTRDKLDD